MTLAVLDHNGDERAHEIVQTAQNILYQLWLASEAAPGRSEYSSERVEVQSSPLPLVQSIDHEA